jgi:hypothetical protein
MFDIRAIRETPDVFRKAWSRRKAGLGEETVSRILELDTAWRAATTAKQDAESARNANSKLIGQAKARKDEAEAARLMARIGIVTASMLARGRRYAIVGILAFAAVFTPPDPMSQILLAVPVYLLYEISIFCVKLIEKSAARAESATP